MQVKRPPGFVAPPLSLPLPASFVCLRHAPPFVPCFKAPLGYAGGMQSAAIGLSMLLSSQYLARRCSKWLHATWLSSSSRPPRAPPKQPLHAIWPAGNSSGIFTMHRSYRPLIHTQWSYQSNPTMYLIDTTERKSSIPCHYGRGGNGLVSESHFYI